MKNLIIRSTAVLALMTATSAFAQDFDGFYLGGSIGQTEGASVAIPQTYAKNGDGATFGAFAGYNYQTSNNFIFGTELAYKGGSVDHPMVPPFLADSLYSQNYLDVKAKLGYVFSPNTMGYVVGGRSTADLVNTVGIWTTHYALEGLNYGIGVEQKINPNMTVGIEIIKRELDSVSGPAIDYDGIDYSLRAAYHF